MILKSHLIPSNGNAHQTRNWKKIEAHWEFIRQNEGVLNLTHISIRKLNYGLPRKLGDQNDEGE